MDCLKKEKTWTLGKGDFSDGNTVFPQTGLPVGFYLRKNRLDTLVGALGLVGRGFGPAGRAGLGWDGLCWPCWLG